MSRMLITVIIIYVLTRLFYGISGFDPHRIIPKWTGYLVDLGIWLLVGWGVYWALTVLGIGKVRDQMAGRPQG